MPRYNRNKFYEAVVIAYINEKIIAGQPMPGNRAMSDDLGFSNVTIINAVRRLVAAQRLAADRDSRGKLFNYQVKTPPSKLERRYLSLQREIKKAASDSLAA